MSDKDGCHHIINSHELLKMAGQPSPHKGNLWLGGVKATKPDIIGKNKIGAILSILDQPMMKHFKVVQNLQHVQIAKQNHKWIDLEDQQDCDIYNHFVPSANFLESKLNDTNVLVHCQMGISRSSSLVIGYLMIKHRMSLDNALNLVKKKRSFIDPNDGFLKQLKMLEKEVKKNA